MKPRWTVEKVPFGWRTVVNDEGETVDASGDGGFYEETAKRVAECENIYFETALTPYQLLEQRDQLLEALEDILFDIECPARRASAIAVVAKAKGE